MFKNLLLSKKEILLIASLGFIAIAIVLFTMTMVATIRSLNSVFTQEKTNKTTLLIDEESIKEAASLLQNETITD